MVVYLYRWKLKPEKIQQFEEAWSRVTLELREKAGSLGSRLHRGSDGLFYGYAQWPSQQMREQATLSSDEIQQARLIMSDAVEERFPEIILEPVADFLKL